MERRLLKIDDGDDSYQGPWPGLDRREAALTALMEGEDE